MLDAHVRAALRRLEAEDERDALEGRTERSLAVLPTTGALLYCLALAQTQRGTARDRRFTRLLDDLDRGRGARELGRLVSLEAHESKLASSAENIAAAGLGGCVEVLAGNAFETLSRLPGPFEFVFLDAWKGDYEALFGLVRPKLSPGRSWWPTTSSRTHPCSPPTAQPARPTLACLV